MEKSILHLIGYQFGYAGVDPRCAEGPVVLKNSAYLQAWPDYSWDDTVSFSGDPLHVGEAVNTVCVSLAQKVSKLVRQQEHFCVIGGDHTSALGTWSGVYDALYQQGDIGLIWIDAHMDSHTMETTESGRIHGMPLACLMGHGYRTLTNILHADPKLKPGNVCLIGVRSFEEGEAELLRRLNVKVYLMDEVQARGIHVILQEAVARVSANTIGYGMSIDLDVLDPDEVPAVDVPEMNGIGAAEFCEALAQVVADPKLIGTEIVEFDPHRDRQHMTEKLIVTMLKIIGAR